MQRKQMGSYWILSREAQDKLSASVEKIMLSL